MNIEGRCGRPSDIEEDIICTYCRNDEIIPHSKTLPYISQQQIINYYYGKVGFIRLQSGELIYRP